MATYAEIFDLGNNSALRNKFTVASLVAAQAVMVESGSTTNHANRLLWAKSVFADPQGMGQKMLMAGLAANAALTVAQITAAADSSLLTTVQAAIDLFATSA
jgi:hypothetical protein